MCSPECILKLKEKIPEILLSNGIKEPVSEVIVEDSGSKGDGFASSRQVVTVTFQPGEDNSDPRGPLHLFVKLHTENASHEGMLDDLKAFEKESRFFMEYVPDARELCKAKGLGDYLDFYPTCYYGDESMVVLENLVLSKGYELLAYDGLYDFETTVFPLKTLAKQHAVAHAVIQEVGGAEKFFQKYPNLDHDGFKTDTLIKMIVTSCENIVKTNIAILEKTQIDGKDEMIAKLNSFAGTSTAMIWDWLETDDNLLVLNHGDYKSTNMMFLRDKESKKIINHMAIDLQTSRYNSPALDLTYFLFGNVLHTVRQSRFNDLLDCYRVTLNEVTKQLGHPVELSSEDLMLSVRRKFKFGFWIAMHAVGPGIKLYKNLDIDTVDVSDWANVMQGVLLKWIEEHPEEHKKMADEIKSLLEEYEVLEL